MCVLQDQTIKIPHQLGPQSDCGVQIGIHSHSSCLVFGVLATTTMTHTKHQKDGRETCFNHVLPSLSQSSAIVTKCSIRQQQHHLAEVQNAFPLFFIQLVSFHPCCSLLPISHFGVSCVSLFFPFLLLPSLVHFIAPLESHTRVHPPDNHTPQHPFGKNQQAKVDNEQTKVTKWKQQQTKNNI